MKYFNSPEVEKLQKLIKSKEDYLPKLTNKYSYQQLQMEILFLRNEIMPIVLSNTNIIHSEVAKAATMAFETALEYHVNALLMYIPIDENYINDPVIGIYNPKSLLKFGTPGAIELYCEIINMDGNDSKFSPLNLPINPLIHGNK